MASALLWPSFKENYFKIWGSETPAGVSEPLFHGWGAKENGICWLSVA